MFQLHRIFLIAAIVCTAVAFIIIFVETNGIYIFVSRTFLVYFGLFHSKIRPR